MTLEESFHHLDMENPPASRMTDDEARQMLSEEREIYAGYRKQDPDGTDPDIDNARRESGKLISELQNQLTQRSRHVC